MSNDEPAFWRAIEAAPHDHLPLSVYADWLDEHGDGATAAALREDIKWNADQWGISCEIRAAASLGRITGRQAETLSLVAGALAITSRDAANEALRCRGYTGPRPNQR